MSETISTPQDKLRIEANYHKANSLTRGALLRRVRNRLVLITDQIEDEGDRAYFGSTNDADDLRAFVDEIENWHWSKILAKDEGLEDPYAMLREQRARADQAEAELLSLREHLRAAMLCENQTAFKEKRAVADWYERAANLLLESPDAR